MCRLGFPDYEIDQSFNTQLLAHYNGFKESTIFQLFMRVEKVNAPLQD